VPQCFVEICAVLFVNVNLTGHWNAFKVRPYGIKITNHRRQINIRFQSMTRPAVGGDTNRRKRKRFNNISVINRTATQKGHWNGTLNNTCIH